MTISDSRLGRAPLPMLHPPATAPEAEANRFADVPTADRIAATRDVVEVYRRGSLALSTILEPTHCLVFDRDEYGQLGLAHRLNIVSEEGYETAPLTIADQVQSWWLGIVQVSGPPRATRPALLPETTNTIVLPLIASDSLHGIVVLQDCAKPLDAAAEREIIALGTTMSQTLHIIIQRDQLAKALLPEQVEEAITQERRRIAREIHDGVAQSLAYLNLKTELLDRLVERDPAAAREQAGVVRQLLQSAMTDLRRCIGDLRRPAAGQGQAITAQLRTLANNLGEMPNLELALQQVSGTRLAPEVERTVIGIVREALHNIRKHAQANSVHVEVTREAGGLRVLVQDDGQGFEIAAPRADAAQHFGLTQMRELAHEMGGQLSIESEPGTGTRVEALIPLRAAPPPQSASRAAPKIPTATE